MVVYIIYIVVTIIIVFNIWLWTKWWIKYIRINKKTKDILDTIYVSIKIVSDYGAFLEMTSEEGLVFVPESRLPHSKEKIKNAIGCVEFFIEKALSDERLKKGFIEHPAAVLFGKNGAEYIFSEKYRRLLKVGLTLLLAFVSDELAEKCRKSKIVMDYMDNKGIKSTDNLTAEEWEDFRKVIKEAYKL